MIDLIKKLYDWENDPSLIERIKTIEAAENIAFLINNGEDAEKPDPDEHLTFFERLFKRVKTAQEQDKKIPFRIFFLNMETMTLVVKVHGLFAQLPIQQMAWQYPDMEFWKIIFPTLQGIEFKCKVIEAFPKEDERFHIVVDATAHTFYSAELIENAEYTGIILQRTEDELLIDIGIQFKWKYGSLCGFLPLEELDSPETFQSCNPGDRITIEYTGYNDRGLQFISVKPVDPEEYIGKITWVQIGKGTAPYFMVEGKYKGELPITKTYYPTKKKKVRRLREQWENGDIIQCEVLEYKSHRGFILKWIDDEPDEINWKSEELNEYIGRQVPVHVYLTDGDNMNFLVENKYPATLSGRDRSSKKEHLRDGQIITAQIRSIDLEEKCFKIRWASWWL